LGNGTLAGIGTTYLGVGAGPHFGTNPTQLFGTATDTNNDAHVIRCQLPASGDSYYSATVASGSYARCTWTDMSPNPNNLSAIMVAFDPTYDKARFSNFANQVVQGNYLLFHALRGNQDSYGWLGAVDISSNQVSGMAGLAPLWKRGGADDKSFRGCAIHAMHPVLGTHKMSFTGKTMYQSGQGMGPYTSTLSAAMTISQTTISLISNTPTSPYPDTTLYDVASGDEISVDGESMYLGSNVGGTTWNVSRAKARTVGRRITVGLA
jgi:hypothetical protein